MSSTHDFANSLRKHHSLPARKLKDTSNSIIPLLSEHQHVLIPIAVRNSQRKKRRLAGWVHTYYDNVLTDLARIWHDKYYKTMFLRTLQQEAVYSRRCEEFNSVVL